MDGSRNRQVIAAPPTEVFAALSDPGTYPRWLVGAQSIRSVDKAWPEVGSSFRHRIGVGPLHVPGSTTVRAVERPRLFELAAGMGPFGEARVRFEVTPAPEGTAVEIAEEPTKGIAGVARRVAGPLVRLLLWGRNEASLDALRELVEAGLVEGGSPLTSR